VLPLFGATSAAATGGPLIDVTNLGVSQLFPRDGTITSITARFSATLAQVLAPSTVEIQATLYTGAATSNILATVAGSTCTLSPGYGPFVLIGQIATCTVSTNIPISNGTQGAVVFSAPAGSGPSENSSITGIASVSMTYA
jgi:hypothetical protein